MRAGGWADGLRFLGGFLRRPVTTGSVWPSSRRLAAALAETIDAKPGDTVLEFGPGSGPVTRAISARLPEGAHYLGIDINPDFVALLRTRFPALRFREGCVTEAARFLEEEGLPRPKWIICGLPFGNLPRDLARRVMQHAAETLAHGGEMRMFQYVHAYRLHTSTGARKQMSEHFAEVVRARAVWANMPPAYVVAARV